MTYEIALNLWVVASWLLRQLHPKCKQNSLHSGQIPENGTFNINVASIVEGKSP